MARRHKKAFLSDQCKEIEGNNRMGKKRIFSFEKISLLENFLFKKIRDTKGAFHVKMGTKKRTETVRT